MSRQRLDQTLVALGLAPSRTRAAALVKAGVVAVAGTRASRASQKVEAADVSLTGNPNPWVSRAALKLVHGLEVFGLDPAGMVAADIGASTGGFSEVLLAHGAARVVAIDVGHGQLHPDVASDPRLENRERTNARHLDPASLPPLDLVVSDVSFISQTKALGPALSRVRPGGQLVSLVKPQFELGPERIGKGGIVRDPAGPEDALDLVSGWLTGLGWQVTGQCDSPILGSDGNRELLLCARLPMPATPSDPSAR